MGGAWITPSLPLFPLAPAQPPVGPHHNKGDAEAKHAGDDAELVGAAQVHAEMVKVERPVEAGGTQRQGEGQDHELSFHMLPWMVVLRASLRVVGARVADEG